MRFLYASFVITMILAGCTPATQEKSVPLTERIISEMSVEPPQKEKIIEPEKTVTEKNITVRVGIMENESEILFSCSGLFSISSGGKTIFTKKKSQGSWKITAQNRNLLFENT